MSRDFDPSELDDFRASANTPHNRVPPPEARPTPYREPRPNSAIKRDAQALPERQPVDIRSKDGRAELQDRDRSYRLRVSEIQTLTELGKFRVIATEDLAKHSYQNHRDEAQKDIRDLIQEGLVERRAFNDRDDKPRELLTLTKTGHRLVRANRLVPEGQATYHGFVKPREANHDADLYRLYQKEAEKITGNGGRNLRVVLDYEFKKKLNRDLANSGTESRSEIAARHGLRVVHNKIPIPDLRIEYETREGTTGRVDLELATNDYRPRQVAEKVHAGFSLYASRGDADHLRRVLDQQELTAEILSL